MPPETIMKSGISNMREYPMQAKSGDNKNLGDSGEKLAAEHLRGLGFKILDTKVRYKCAEIDIVAKKRGELHFIEVKTRRDLSLASPFDAITETKKRHMKTAARLYLSSRKNNFKYDDLPPCFFSIIGIDISGVRPKIECIWDAFA